MASEDDISKAKSGDLAHVEHVAPDYGQAVNAK